MEKFLRFWLGGEGLRFACMSGLSTPIIVLVVVCFNTTLFASLGLYLWRQG